MTFPARGRTGRLVPFQGSASRRYHHNLENELEPSLPIGDGEDFEETLDEWKSGVLTDTVHQMMFVVSMDKTEPSVETTTMIEEIIQKQVKQMVSDTNLKCPRDANLYNHS